MARGGMRSKWRPGEKGEGKRNEGKGQRRSGKLMIDKGAAAPLGGVPQRKGQ